MNGRAAVADEVLGNVTSALRARGMWARTLLLHSSDNGAPSGLLSSGHSGNNWPLRGGKGNLFEGSTEPRPESARQSTRVAVRAETHHLSRSGVRVPAFVAGGFVPAAARGTQAGGYVHICDTTALEHLPLLLRLCYFPFAAARIPLLAAGDWYRTLLRLAGVAEPTFVAPAGAAAVVAARVVVAGVAVGGRPGRGGGSGGGRAASEAPPPLRRAP